MENIYVYCVREQTHCRRAHTYFKIGRADDLQGRSSLMQAIHAKPPRTVIILGPFLDRDEAETVESQAHSLLSRFEVQEGRYRINPLQVSGFWEWIDAQILPICVYEKTAFPCQPSELGPMDCRPTVSLRRSADVEGRASDSPEEARS